MRLLHIDATTGLRYRQIIEYTVCSEEIDMKQIFGAAIFALSLVAAAAPAEAYVLYDFRLGNNVIQFSGPDGDFNARPTNSECTIDNADFRDIYEEMGGWPSSEGEVLLQTYPCEGNIISVCLRAFGDSDEICATVRKSW